MGVEDDEHEVVTTREACKVGTGTTGPRCKKLLTERELCRPGTGSTGPICRELVEADQMREEDGHYEEVTTREACRPGTGSTGPICKRVILKREDCHRVGGMTHCNRMEDEEHEKVEMRMECPPTLFKCKRVFVKKEVCRTGAAGRPNCH